MVAERAVYDLDDWSLCQRKAQKIVKDSSHPSHRLVLSATTRQAVPERTIYIASPSVFTLLLLSVYYLCIVTLQINLSNLYPCTLTRYRYSLYIALLLLCHFTLVYLVNIFLTLFLELHCWLRACK